MCALRTCGDPSSSKRWTRSPDATVDVVPQGDSAVTVSSSADLAQDAVQRAVYELVAGFALIVAARRHRGEERHRHGEGGAVTGSGLATLMRPSWASISALAIASPMPEPPRPRTRAESAR